MEVFVNDFSIFGSSFHVCLVNLSIVLKQCEEVNVFLSWKKSNFTVQAGIALGHSVSKKGIKVDKVKGDIISNLLMPFSMKWVRSFLGHVDFHRRLIKDFSKVVRPLTCLLTKDAPFMINVSCVKAFAKIHSLLVSALLCSPLIFLLQLRLCVMHLILLLRLF